jgi:redox-sensitive bicupin YhaK (pirin superfamily)
MCSIKPMDEQIMMIRKSHERGRADFGWLQSAHSFSFGQYYDPKHMGVSALRVINDDTIAPSSGFDTHGHRDMEIISYVTKGALRHKDSTGNDYVIPAGDIQVMSAGSGIFHSEYNNSDTEEAKFFQIWIQPNVRGIEPGYGQTKVEQDGKLTALITPDGKNGTLAIHQDAVLSRLVLNSGEDINLSTGSRVGYLHVIEGSISVENENGKEELNLGDAAILNKNESASVIANADAEAMWFDLPATF